MTEKLYRYGSTATGTRYIRDLQAERDERLGMEVRAELHRCGILTAQKAEKEAAWPGGNSSAVMYAIAAILTQEGCR